MKIAIVIERIETWRGGAETSTMEFAQLLAGRGHDVHLVTASRAPSTPDLQIHQIGVATPLRPLRTSLFLRKAALHLGRYDFDIVHAIAPLPTADVYEPRGGAVRETLERNVALRPTGGARAWKRAVSALDLKTRTLLALERRICRPGGPVIVAVSNYVARQFERHYRVTPPRVRVIFNGVRLNGDDDAARAAEREQIRARHRAGPGTLVLLCIAHNFRLKGVPRVIDALAAVIRAGSMDVVAWIVGRDNPAPLLRQAEAVGVAERIRFIGPTTRAGAYLSAADALVHATYYDPCSRVVLEALSRGVATITTRHNGAAEIMTDDVDGYVIDSADDVDALADRIRRLADPATRGRLGEAALRLRPRLDMQRHVAEMEGLYEELRRHGERSRGEKSTGEQSVANV